jgi:hypothetical protein
MDLKKAYKEWEQDPDSLNPERKRSLPKRWKSMLDRYNRRKSICSFCFNKFNLEDLTAMSDGGSGGICKKCKEQK